MSAGYLLPLSVVVRRHRFSYLGIFISMKPNVFLRDRIVYGWEILPIYNCCGAFISNRFDNVCLSMFMYSHVLESSLIYYS